jgi:hypothetical protein
VSRIGAASLALGLMAAGAGMQLGQLARARTLAAAVLDPPPGAAADRLGAVAPVRAGRGADHRAAGLLGPAHGLDLLCAGGAHGLQRAYVAGLVTLSTLLGVASLPLALGLLR